MADAARPARARSMLFVPGTRPDRFDKASRAGADLVVVDLEDSVEPAAKEVARHNVTNWLGATSAPVAVRINELGSPVGSADVEALLAGVDRHVLAAVLIPKTEAPDALAGLTQRLGRSVALIPIIETPIGLDHVKDVASAPQVCRLVAGDLDLSGRLGCDFEFGGGLVGSIAKFGIVLASRLAGLARPVDGACPDFSDPSKIIEESRRARALGFGAKVCIHPAQVAAVHEGFAPSPDELRRARRVVAAARNAPGVFTVDGRMVDKPVIDWAEDVLATVGDREERDSCTH